MSNHESGSSGVKRLAPEEVVLHAMGAYDALARCTIVGSRADGLTKTQTDILMRLSFCGKASMSRMADELAVSKEHITRAVGVLVDRGFVEKHRGTENFRLVKASLTPEGAEVARNIRLASIKRLNERLAEISPEDRAALLEASEQAEAILSKITGR